MSSLPNPWSLADPFFLPPDVDRLSLFQKGPDALFIVVPRESRDPYAVPFRFGMLANAFLKQEPPVITDPRVRGNDE
jgi:hypothetical protein